MSNEELLLAIHEQCEAVQEAIGKHYYVSNVAITKEISYLLALIMGYILKHP